MKKMWDADSIWLPQIIKGKNLICTINFSKNFKVLSLNLNIIDKF